MWKLSELLKITVFYAYNNATVKRLGRAGIIVVKNVCPFDSQNIHKEMNIKKC